VALSPSEIQTIDRLRQQWESQGKADELNLRYYLGRQRVEQLGMAIPPSMRKFLVVANWPRVVVDTMRSRQRMRSMMLAGEDAVNPQLLAARRATNLDAHLAMFETDVLVYGRGFLSCGSNEAAAGSPLVRAESPRQMVAEVDIRTETMLAAARFYGKDEQTGATPTNVTLYLPEVTIWVARGGDGRWVEVDRDPHGLGRVPIVMHLNRRMSGEWAGESEMSDIIPITDAAARSLTNMQFAQESHGIPRMWMTGVAKGDFVDASGKPIPQFEAYFNAIHTLTKAESKVGQLEASDLKNFETALDGNPVTIDACDPYTLSAVSKFLRSEASNCPTFDSALVRVWIALKYASNCGIGLPLASTKSPLATPVIHMRGMPCDSCANCIFVSDRAAASVIGMMSLISDSPAHSPDMRRFRCITIGTRPSP
jgi:hypothetical protein